MGRLPGDVLGVVADLLEISRDPQEAPKPAAVGLAQGGLGDRRVDPALHESPEIIEASSRSTTFRALASFPSRTAPIASVSWKRTAFTIFAISGSRGRGNASERPARVRRS